MDIQTEFFVQLIVESAMNLGKHQYAAQLRKDSILQKEICDLVSHQIVSQTCT